jgi:hypothetical protein
MKKIYLIILFVLLLPVTSAFALVLGGTATGQQVLLPYVVNEADGSWWSGLAITNTSGSSMTFSIGAYTKTGTWVSGNSFTVPAHGMEVRAVGAFFTTPPTGQFSVWIRCSTDGASSFQVTLFVGNDFAGEGGFGFQTTTSWDWTYTTGVIFDPFLPVVIPKFPIPIIPLM